ncbi:hypothetical protein [Bosea sp. (in: a-proteobacteria)]|uniref:hypothetical protein n=1 Tax=Bosea sp. (in: a-proteobacteria) TaxID=1871050 RepID=UPI00334281C4
MKRPNRLSQAMRRATSKREQARRRKEREARFPKPKLVPDEGEAADRADQAEPKNTAPVRPRLACVPKPGCEPLHPSR